MQKIFKNQYRMNKDFIEIDLEKAKVVFSTAEKNRSFNRYTEEGRKNIESIVEEYNISDVKYLNQVHSDKSYIFESGKNDVIDYEGDAVITSEKRIAVGVFTADCVPIIMVNEKVGIVAAVHSGWKGTYNSITLKTLEKIKSEYNVDPMDIKVYIGAHIRQCCYEVSEELKEKFLSRTGIEEDILFKERNLNMEECILKDLRQGGIKEENIFSLDLCTHCERDIALHSYRGCSGTYGRLFSFAFIK